MKIVFMGTPEFAVESLKELIKSPNEILEVFTQPDTPRDRGKSVKASPVKELAQASDIPVKTPVRLQDSQIIEFLKDLSPDIIIVVAYGRLIPKTILDIPKYGCINAHASLLPDHRGAAPIQRAIMQGDKETGISIIKLVEALDAGPILWKEKIKIGDDENFVSLHDRLTILAAKGLVETSRLIEENKITPEKQDDSKATYAFKIKPEEELVEWGSTAECVHNHIRAFDPYPGAYSTIRGHRIKIFSSHIVKNTGSGNVGEIIAIKKEGLEIQTSKGTVIIKDLQPANKKRMSAFDFANGARITKGLKFGD